VRELGDDRLVELGDAPVELFVDERRQQLVVVIEMAGVEGQYGWLCGTALASMRMSRVKTQSATG
jgi:hypothetical protein